MAVKFSQFDGTVAPSKTSTTQYIVGFEGNTNIRWTMKEIADEIGGSTGGNIYTVDGTLTGNRTVTQDGNQLSWDMGTGSQTFTTSSSSGTWMNLRVGGGQKGALLAVSGGGGMYFRDSGGSDYYNLSQNGFYLNRNAGFGIQPQANQRLTIKGAGLTGSTYGLRVQNVDTNDLLYIKDNGDYAVKSTAGVDRLTINSDGSAGLTIAKTQNYTIKNTVGGTINTLQANNNGCIETWYFGGFQKAQLNANSGQFGVSDVGITSGMTDASALITMRSTTKGLLPPRMTNTQRDAISSPTAGLMLYSSTDSKIQFYNGSAWTDAGGGGDSIYTADGNITTGTNRIVTLAGTATLAFYGAQNQGDFRIGYDQGSTSRGRSNYSIQQSGDQINTYCYQSNHYVNSNSDPLNTGYGPGTNYLSISAQGLEHHKVSVGIGINGTTSDRLVVKGNGTTSGTHSVRVLDGSDVSMFSIRNDGAIALGSGAAHSNATGGPTSVVIGASAATNGSNGMVAIGGSASAGNGQSTCIGYNSTTSNPYVTNLGAYTQNAADYGVSLGYGARGSGAYNVQLGYQARGTGANSITITSCGGTVAPSTANAFGVYMTSNTTPDFRVIGAEGMVPPSITTTVRDAISSPISGSTIYNTTDNKLQFYNGTDWTDAGGGSSLWTEDSGTPGNISPAGGNNVDVAIGTTPVNGQRLIIRGSGTTTTTAFKIEDSAGNLKLLVTDNGVVKFAGPPGFGNTEIKTYGNSGVSGTTIGNSSGQSFVVGLQGLGTTGSRFTIGAVPVNGTAQFNLFTTSNGTNDAVQWKNSSSELLLDMKENGRTSFHGQVSVGLKSSAAIDGIDWDEGNIQEVTLVSGANDFDPTNEIPGSTYILKITQPSSADGTIDWESTTATVNWPGGTAPTLTATNGAVDIVTLVCTAANTYYGTSALNFS